MSGAHGQHTAVDEKRGANFCTLEVSAVNFRFKLSRLPPAHPWLKRPGSRLFRPFSAGGIRALPAFKQAAAACLEHTDNTRRWTKREARTSDQGCPLSSFPKVTASAQRLSKSASSLPQQLCREDLAAAMQTLHSGRLYRPAPKSSSADLFIKQPTLTIEVQDKSGVSTGVSFADVCQEVKKCIQEGPVLWVLVALKLNELLSRCVGEARPLVLESGTYQEEELADGGSGGLLYRPESRKSWQKRIQNGEWHDVTTKIQPKGKGQTLQVRQELQLVIPHPKHVKEFLGESDFEIVKELAKNPSDRMVDIPFLSRFYNFQQPPAQGTRHFWLSNLHQFEASV